MTIKKFISFRLFTMLLMLCIASCSLNKDSLLNDNKADNNYGKHLAHNGTFGRCSLCASKLQAIKSTDSAIMPLAVQPEEQEQIFASNATQENIILKPSKYNFEESFENFENSSSTGEKDSFSTKKSNSYKFQQQSKPESKKSYFIPLLILTISIILSIVGGGGVVFTIFWAFFLIYGIGSLLKLLSFSFKETPTKKKKKWYLIPLLILASIMGLASIIGLASIMGLTIGYYIFFLVPLFFLIAPITLIYLIIKAIKSRKVKKSAKQKAEIFAILGLILAIMTLVFVIGAA